MNLVIKRRNPYENPEKMESVSFLSGRIGFWGYVQEVYGSTLTVDVLSDLGWLCRNVAVASAEWVNGDTGTGERNLPPVGSRVFVLTPCGSLQGAFVLCSGFAKGDAGEKDGFRAKEESGEEDCCAVRKCVRPDGWTVEKDERTGTLQAFHKGGEVSFSCVPADGDAAVKVEAFGTEITVTGDGAEFSFPGNITLQVSGDLTVETDGNVDFSGGKFSVNGAFEVSG